MGKVHLKTLVLKEEYRRLKEAESLKDEYLMHLKRLKADFENYKKRVEKERAEVRQRANLELIIDLLPVFDDLVRAIEITEQHKNFESIFDGIKLVKKHFDKFLERNGVRHFESVGERFDPKFHEAMYQVETDEHPEGVVVSEFQKGFLLGDKVIRPAKVSVSKAKCKAETKG